MDSSVNAFLIAISFQVMAEVLQTKLQEALQAQQASNNESAST